MSETQPSALTAPWLQRQLGQLLAQQGQAWLLQGPSGLGQFDLALALVRAWLCERPSRNPDSPGACGQCASCHAIDVHAHPDLFVLMPETQMLARGWPLGEKAQEDIDSKKRKPSKEIRVDALRDALAFSQLTESNAQGKAVLIYPAEQMNTVAANALLKTLEEPPGHLRFVLASDDAQRLLPTLRSRCMAHTLQWSAQGESEAWLVEQGLPHAEATELLRACGGRPQDVLDWRAAGISSADWRQLPQAVLQGDAAALASWTPPALIAALQKLAHDVTAQALGAPPRFFAPDALPNTSADLRTLSAWFKALSQSARTAEHPFHAALMTEALVSQAQMVLKPRALKGSAIKSSAHPNSSRR